MERFNKTIISKTPLKIVVGIYGLISTLWWWVFESLSHVRLLQTHELQPAWVLCPWDFPGNNTAVGSFSLLQGIFPTEGLNLRLLHCSQILYRLRYKGNSVWLRCLVIYLVCLYTTCNTIWTFIITKYTERKLVLLANILLSFLLKYIFFSNYINIFYDCSLSQFSSSF